MEVHSIHPSQIKVKDGLDRFRTDMGDLKKLALSFERYGQLNPIVINKNMELIAGGRRLATCLLINKDIRYVFVDETDELRMREMELEENVQRKDFTPIEHALAVKEIHDLKQKFEGVTIRGSPNSGWGIDQTAQFLGISHTSVAVYLQIAEASSTHPELAGCKTRQEILQTMKGLAKVEERSKALASFQSSNPQLNFDAILRCRNMKDDIITLPDNSIDIILTDPPYMLDINELVRGIGGKTGGSNVQGFKYDDTPDFTIYRALAKESNRVCRKDRAFVYVFISCDFFQDVRKIFIQAGWEVGVRPLIWIKPGGSCNMPKKWPISAYEMILFARRPIGDLVVEGMRDWIQTNPVPPNAKSHPAEKPLELAHNLLSRVALPGMSLYDPFCGSGAFLVAGIQASLKVQGCDILPEAIDCTKEKLILELKKGVNIV